MALPRSTMSVVIGSAGLTVGGIGTILTVYGNPWFYSSILMPFLRKILDPEVSHELSINMLGSGHGVPLRNSRYNDPKNLSTELYGIHFTNPIGLSAGCDKNGKALLGFMKMGFGFVEAGTVTPKPQLGNPKPRVFRLQKDRAIINRLGFNSEGGPAVRRNILKTSDKSNCVFGINIGKNKVGEYDDVTEYRNILRCIADTYPDYIVVNVSSPNTPGLRSLQSSSMMSQLISNLKNDRAVLFPSKKPPILVKIAPDLDDDLIKEIANIATDETFAPDGLVISNTTVSRPPSLLSESRSETGGLSGEPLKDMSTELIRRMYRLTSGRIPIIGVGGVSTGADAYEKIKAGASLVQLYTALVYHGPPRVVTIKQELSQLLEVDGYSSVAEAVGADCKK